MLYVTGDTHGEENRFWYMDSTIEKILEKDDKLFIAGDWGYIRDDSCRERKFLKFLSEKPYLILWIDGNHENFTLIRKYPVEEWCGGKVHVISRDSEGKPKIIHLMRGQVFTIEGKRIFTMGGACSRDQEMRIPYQSWWPEEMPDQEEMMEALSNLKRFDYEVDYIITHTGPESVVCSLPVCGEIKEKPLNCFLEWVKEHVMYRHWYMGHHHVERDMNDNISILWFQLRNMETDERYGE